MVGGVRSLTKAGRQASNAISAFRLFLAMYRVVVLRCDPAIDAGSMALLEGLPFFLRSHVYEAPEAG